MKQKFTRKNGKKRQTASTTITDKHAKFYADKVLNLTVVNRIQNYKCTECECITTEKGLFLAEGKLHIVSLKCHRKRTMFYIMILGLYGYNCLLYNSKGKYVHRQH